MTGTFADPVAAEASPARRRKQVLDRGGPRRGDLFRASTAWQAVIPFTRLFSGTHTITVKPLGTKNASSSSSDVVFDAFVALT